MSGSTISLIVVSVILLATIVGLVFCSTLTMEICLDGQDNLTLDYGTDYTDPGAYAIVRSNLIPGFGIELPVALPSIPDSAELGEVTLQYEAKFLWIRCFAVRTVNLVDAVAPVIALNSNPDSFTLPGHAYEEEGFTAIDNRDGDITHLVKRTVSDTEIIYTVTDSSGNTTEVRRSIRYDDPVAPELNLLGDTQITLLSGTPFTEPGYTAVDNCDGDLTSHVRVDGSVNVAVPGTYTLTYTATDAHGNTTTATRTVIVEQMKQPDIVEPTGKVIYLTFDDGPCSYTDRLLDILAKYNVKATFFVTNQSPKYAGAMKRIVNEGHAIGIHTYSHNYSAIYSSKEGFFNDFNAIRQVIYEQTGEWTTLCRFPGGSGASMFKKYYAGINAELVKDLTNMGYQYFDWNVSSEDTGANKTADAVYNAVIAGIKKHDVSCVLQHDIKSHSVDAVEKIIQWGLANGYTFLPLDATSPVFHQNINR